MTETVNLITEVKPTSAEGALDLLLEALHEWAYEAPGLQRDEKLGARLWAIICAVHPKQPTKEQIAWAKEGMKERYKGDVTIPVRGDIG